MGLDSSLQGVNPDVYEADHGTYAYYDPSQLKIPLLQYEDDETGLQLTTVVNDADTDNGVRRQSWDAWSMARQSRSDDDPLSIFQEMVGSDVDPEQKLSYIFNRYGHASVADMSEIAVQFEDVPFHVPLAVFNYGVQNSGQEKSTRYQPQFAETELDDLDHYLDVVPDRLRSAYDDVRRHAQELFRKHHGVVGDAFRDHFEPGSDEEASSLEARVFDAVRGTLLAGQKTGFGFKTTSRRWGDLISLLKGSANPRLRGVGRSVDNLLDPDEAAEEKLGFKAEAPGLHRYTDAETRRREGFEAFRDDFLPKTGFYDEVSVVDEPRGMVMNTGGVVDGMSNPEKTLYQAVKRAHPGSDDEETLQYIRSLSDDELREASDLFFGSYTHHVSPSDDTAVTNTTARFTTSLAEARDWNRHRAWSRFLGGLPDLTGPTPTTQTFRELLGKGHVLPRYVTEDDTFQDERAMMNEDYEALFNAVDDFIDVAEQTVDDPNKSFLMNTLPFATATDVLMHGNPRQSHYLTFLRHRPGGHINYRVEAYQANQAFADAHPFYEGMRLPREKEPEPLSEGEFFDRS